MGEVRLLVVIDILGLVATGFGGKDGGGRMVGRGLDQRYKASSRVVRARVPRREGSAPIRLVGAAPSCLQSGRGSRKPEFVSVA